ncbi:hypothetical protein MMC06_004565 [Schaereria dolodes]|nr:hypothetical protein [Schaereria dolodes]
MIIVLLCIHAALYMNFYFQLSLLSKRIRDSDVQLGLAAITSFLLIGTTTLSVIRNYSYRVFYIIHITFSCSILPILFFHVTHIRIYIIETTLIYLFVVLQRFFLVKRSRNAFLNKIPKTSLISISLGAPSTSATGKHDPGQHVYLSLPHNPSSPLNVFRKNPFTIANNPLKNDDRIYLVARQMSGMTRLLSELAHDFHRGPVDLIVERPKGASASFPDLLQYDRILFVAGGVGATYTIPIYRSLLRRVYSMHKKARSEPKKNMLRFVWSVRNPAETWWGINAVKEQYGKIPDGFELYVTSTQAEKLKEADRARNEDQEPIVKDITMSIGRGTDPSLAGILTEMADAIKPVDEDEMKKIIRRGRPDLKVLVDEIFGDNRVERVAVLVCGPVEMGRALRREVGKWVSRGKEVFWHDEQFWW